MQPSELYALWCHRAVEDPDLTAELRTIAEDADAIKAVVDNTVIAVGYSSDQITSIINEEAASYFNGEKSAQDVAATIQNRVSIYVSEQS